MSYCDSNQTFRNEAHQLYLSIVFTTLEIFLNSIDSQKYFSKSIFTPLEILMLDEHGLTR